MSQRHDDDRIDSFLKKNQPVAPRINEEKVHATLLAKLGFVAPRPQAGLRPRTTWMAFSGALAAGAVAIFMLSQPMNSTPPPSSAPVTTEAQWDEELFEEELPAMEVGEEFIELMAQNDISGRVTK